MERQQTYDEKILVQNMERRKTLKASGTLVINGVFNDELLESVYFDMEALINDKNISKVRLVISSPGGAVYALMPLISLIERSTKPVETLCLGFACSAAALLLLSGTKGHRSATSRSSILIHEVANEFGHSKVTQLIHDTARLERINKDMVEMIVAKTKMTAAEVDKFMNANQDIFMSAEQAKKFGLIDTIL